MKVLVIGSGGREHAIIWKLKQSKRVSQVFCAPGNGGIAKLAQLVPIQATEVEALCEFALEEEIDVTIVGMDDPLMLGVVDLFEEKGLRIFGPRKNAAIIEGSKSFSKDLMKKYDIPTAGYEVFEDEQKARAYIEKAPLPMVLKADGLALGKGVLICMTREEALRGLSDIMIEKKFGEAGAKLVVEEFISGPEVSVLSFCDGHTVLPMVSAQDHKRAYDHDEGLNTGGMGTFSPSRFYTDEVHEFCVKHVYQKTLDAMKAEGRLFKGIIFFGLMLTEDGPKVLEYNA
ncbi:MAG: phosphoribosylamine--glycine ligase, partial [Vallitaleaceae bacterium]|nr:phosphoribosylamine--glycine ligase [Vallitaleaceae bacterium]